MVPLLLVSHCKSIILPFLKLIQTYFLIFPRKPWFNFLALQWVSMSTFSTSMPGDNARRSHLPWDLVWWLSSVISSYGNEKWDIRGTKCEGKGRTRNKHNITNTCRQNTVLMGVQLWWAAFWKWRFRSRYKHNKYLFPRCGRCNAGQKTWSCRHIDSLEMTLVMNHHRLIWS